MRACLEAAGYRVHAYISPHLVRFHERIRLAGELIGEDALSALLECERANGDAPITFLRSRRRRPFSPSSAPADIVLLEVGSVAASTHQCGAPPGGDRDHAGLARPSELSRRHRAAIAGEKAGILKPGVTAVIGPQPSEAAVIEARAAARRARSTGRSTSGAAMPRAQGCITRASAGILIYRCRR
jgi:dihydrofolate synthase/folylpolyglutamate synthase